MKAATRIRFAPSIQRRPFPNLEMGALPAPCSAGVLPAVAWSYPGDSRRTRSVLLAVALCLVAWQASLAQQSAKLQAQASSSVYAALSPPLDVAAPLSSSVARKTASGVFLRILTSGNSTEHPAESDCVRVRFTGWKRDGSLFSTSGTHGESRVQCMNAMVPGVAEAMALMVPGDKWRIWVPADLTFGKKHHHGHDRMSLDEDPPPHLDLTFDVELLNILKAPPVPADLKMPPDSAVKTSSGLAFKVLHDGAGSQHPSMTSQVVLHYSGWTSDGHLFESTVMGGHPALFQVGTTLPGWREVLQHMVVGEKVRVWVPAALAYGERPVSSMSPAGNLVYDIELLSLQ